MKYFDTIFNVLTNQAQRHLYDSRFISLLRVTCSELKHLYLADSVKPGAY